MALRKLLLFSSILVIIAAQDTLGINNDGKLMPIHYTIEIEPDITRNCFYGEYNASMTILNDTRTITLHSENVVVYEVITKRRLHVSGKPTDSISIIHVDMPIQEEYNYISKTLTLYFENTLRGKYTLNIKYLGKINANDKGLVKIPFAINEGNTSWFLTTHTTMSGACEVFPYLGNAETKTTFNISVKHNKFEKALSSMPKRSFELADDNMAWTHFYTTPVMSTYEIAILIIPKFLTITYTINNTIVLSFWNRNASLPGNLHYDDVRFNIAFKVMSFFQATFGDLEISQINFVAIPGFQHNTIATLGFVLHREEDIMFDRAAFTSYTVQRAKIWRFVARQIALQWFLRSIKPSVWSYQWFNAVAEFFGLYALAKTHESNMMMNRFVVHTVHDSLHLDVDNLMEPISGKKNISSNSTHFRVPPFIKVSALLRMVEDMLGQKFWSDTRSYLHKQSLLPSNIWFCLLSDVRMYTSPSLSNQDCTKWRWIQTSNYPLLRMEQNGSCTYVLYADTTDLITTEKYNNTLIPFLSALLFNIQHTQLYTYHMNPEYPYILQTGNSKKKEVKDCLPVININQVGYYRINYDHEKWKHPEMFINVSSYVKLPVLTRAQIIDDEYHLFLKNEKTYSIWMNIAQYLSVEYDYEAWLPIIKILENMSRFLPFSEHESTIDFKRFFEPSLTKLLRVPANDSDFLRPCLWYEAHKWACLFDSSDCKFFAETELITILNATTFKESVENKNHSGVHPSVVIWQEWIYCDGLRNKDIGILTKLINEYKLKKNFSDAFAKYVPCVGLDKMLHFLNDRDIIYKTLLHWSLEDSENVVLFHSLVAKHANTHIEIILDNFFLLKPSLMKAPAAICIIINHVYSMYSLYKINVFVQRYRSDIFVTQTTFREIKPGDKLKVFEKLKLRESQITRHVNNLMQLWDVQQ